MRRLRKKKGKEFERPKEKEASYIKRTRLDEPRFFSALQNQKMTSFDNLGLRQDILTAIKKLGFYTPTPVQAETIPLILDGKDVIAGSNTGSGKTFAFGAGIIQQLERKQGVQALILVPTRELAEQMVHAFDSFSTGTDVKTATIYGGVSINPQIQALKRADIVIGTPGRTLDHLERKTLNLNHVKHVVLDEADRMLDMGFLPDVKKILKHCPDERQTLLFSATMPPEIKKLAAKFMDKPTHVDLAEHVDPKNLEQETYMVAHQAKPDVLAQLLQEDDQELSIVFCNTRRETDRTTKRLKKAGVKATAIHGGLSQNQRLKVIKMFNSKNKTNVLVCTDVAARGLDIPGVSHVYNYDTPREPKQYIHRIGRTARAGADGKAVNLVSQRDNKEYRQVLKANNLDIPQKQPPQASQQMGAEEADERPKRKPYRQGLQRKGGGKKPYGQGKPSRNPRQKQDGQKPAKGRGGKDIHKWRKRKA